MPVPFVVVHVPPGGVAVRDMLPFTQTSLTVDVIDGASVTTNVSSVIQLFMFLNDIVVFPAVSGVTKPAEVIVATPVLLEDHPLVPNAEPVAESVTASPPAVAVKDPEIVDFEYAVTEYSSVQPLTVYVMFVEPEPTPVTTPDVLTVATPSSSLSHVPPLISTDKLIFSPSQTAVEPEIVGTGVTVTVI